MARFRLPFDQLDHSGGFKANDGDYRGGEVAFSASGVARVLKLEILS
jgi:hypothetical protein